jgi:hypothetical protein
MMREIVVKWGADPSWRIRLEALDGDMSKHFSNDTSGYPLRRIVTYLFVSFEAAQATMHHPTLQKMMHFGRNDASRAEVAVVRAFRPRTSGVSADARSTPRCQEGPPADEQNARGGFPGETLFQEEPGGGDDQYRVQAFEGEDAAEIR